MENKTNKNKLKKNLKSYRKENEKISNQESKKSIQEK